MARFSRWQSRGWFRFLTTGLALFGHRRMFGLSAEGAFWATFTLPWLVLGVVSATSRVAELFGRDVEGDVRTSIIEAAGRVLTPDAITNTLEPLLDSIQQGSTGLTVLGFVVALWSGSRVFATFVAGSEILNGYPPRGFVLTRAIALGIYVLGLLTLGVIVFTILEFPDFWSALLGVAPGSPNLWMIVLAGTGMIAALTTVLYLADPTSVSWAHHLPGGVLALAVWVLASAGLSWYFRTVFQQESLYGAIGSPIAIMTWLFVSVLAMFVGMTMSAAVRLANKRQFLDPLNPQGGPLPIELAAVTAQQVPAPPERPADP